MAQEIIKYEAKVKKLLYTWQYSSNFKMGPKKVKVTSTSIVISGDGYVHNKSPGHYNESVQCPWDLTIPIDCIVNIHHESFKAEGAMHYHKDAVGIDVKIDDSIMNYAIFTNHAKDLFQVIQNSRPQ